MGQPYVIVHEEGIGQAEDWLRLATASHLAGKPVDAQRQYAQALALSPNNPVANQNLAICLMQSGNSVDAMLTIERAHTFAPDVESIWINRVLMLMEVGRTDEAVAMGQSAYQRFNNFETRQMLALAYSAAGMPHEIPKLYNEVLAEHPANYAIGSNACFMQTLMDCTPQDLSKQRAIFYKAQGYKGERKPHTNDRNTDRPLRVGYVGGDFKKHSAPYIFGSVCLFHDKSKVEPYFYCSLPVEPAADPLTEKFKNAGQWRSLDNVSDAQAEAMIRADKIDILVDLAAHTCGGRLPLFSRKPAPVQVTAWGFAHGTGLPEMDYFFADRVSVPIEEREHYTEKIWDLPCIVSYAAPTCPLKPGGPLPYYLNGYITFGAYARYEKMSTEYLETCAQILREVPNSVLMFKDTAFKRPDTIRRVYEEMPDIAKHRLMFQTATSHDNHVQNLPKVDIYLDPWPHSGGTSALEQLYMGCCLLTRMGRQPAGRVSASILTAIGRPEWIAHSAREFIDLAVRMAGKPEALADERRTQHARFVDSPVMANYTERVEAAYQEMFALWACEKRTEHLVGA